MERVSFLIDATGERVDCLLNPETVQVARLAGIRARGVAEGRLTGARLSDDPLLFTGGGRTEIRLDLLFDVDLAEGATHPEDVRALTRRLWTLAENSAEQHGALRPPLVRLVWGKAWNVPGVIAAIAERFDDFTAGGSLRRSWLRMLLVRTDESAASARGYPQRQPVAPLSETAVLARSATASGAPHDGAASITSAAPGAAVTAVGDGPPTGSGGSATGTGYSGVRFDLISHEVLGSPLAWRRLAEHNGIDNPLAVAPGTVLFAPVPGTPKPPLPLSGAVPGAVPS